MAFVNESSRKFITLQDSQLGPGYYCSDSQKNDLKHSCAPFQSTSIRKLNEQSSKFSAPAPGSYELSESSPKKLMILEEQSSTKVYNLTKLQSFFLSRVNRFKQSTTEVPGPANRSSLKHCDEQIKGHSKMSRPKQLLSKIIQQTRENIPTIPGPTQKYGYTETTLKKLQPITRTNEKIIPKDSTVEPTMENLSIYQAHKKDQSDIIMKVKHVIEKHRQIEPLKTGRSQRSVSKTPIDPKRSKQVAQGMACFRNSVSRLNVGPVYEAPGPGTYNAPTFKPKQTKEKFQFFGSTSLRFYEQDSRLPEEQAKPRFSLLRHSTVKPSGKENFSKQKRAVFAQSHDQTPGPGAYDDIPCSPLLKKAVVAIVGTEKRFKTKSSDIPAPGTYEQDSVVEQPKPKKQSLAKKRMIPFPQVRPDIDSSTLKICKIDDVVQNIIKPCFPNYFYSEKPVIPFGSLQQRFGYEQVVAESESQHQKLKQQQLLVNRDVLKSSKPTQASSFISSSPRFNEASILENSNSILPGPGFYNTSEGSSLLKPSYNVKFRG